MALQGGPSQFQGTNQHNSSGSIAHARIPRAAVVRPRANQSPLHTPRLSGPRAVTGTPFSASRALLAHARSIIDVTNAEPLFYLAQNGKLLCRCCVDCSGFAVPFNATRRSTSNPNRNILTNEWRSFKKSLRSHLNLASHCQNSRTFYQRQSLHQTYTNKDTVAGLNLIRLVYENIKTQRSYASFPDSVFVRYLEGTEIGFQNHSEKFPPKIVDCAFETLLDELKRYLCCKTPFDTTLPFGISCDKDKSKNRSRQLTGIRFPSFDSNYHLPFIVTAYLGHPACERFDGDYLAQKIFEQLTSVNILMSHGSMGYTGLSVDGQYLNLKVNELLSGKYSCQSTTIEAWDGAHVVELIFKHSLESSPAISSVIKIVKKITVILKTKVYEQFKSKCSTMQVPFLQPKTPKTLKFVKHGLEQMMNFRSMKPAIVETLKEVGAEGSKLAASCNSYCQQILQPSFDLILSFVIDLMRVLTSFSLQFQKKALYINEYFNLIQLMKEVISNIKLSIDPTATMEIDQGFVFSTFCETVTSGPSQYTGPQRVLRHSPPETSFRLLIMRAVRRCNRFINLLKDYARFYWFTHHYWKDDTKDLLPEIAGFLNHVTNGISKLKLNFISRGKEMCTDCDTFLTEKEQPGHNNGQCQNAVYVTVPSLIVTYRPKTQYDINKLKQFLPRDMHPLLTQSSVDAMLTQLQRAKQQIARSRIEITTDSVSKCFFGTRDYWDRCNKAVLFLFLKCLTVPASEAFMETLGSIMEKYHKRFCNGDPEFDDKRLQKEMALKLNGPPLTSCDPFIKKVLSKYRQSNNPTFAHEQTTLARLSASSMTIRRLLKEAEVDVNRIGCLNFH